MVDLKALKHPIVSSLQASELSGRESAMKANATSDPCIQAVRPARGLGPENARGMRELTRPLQQIWNSKGARDDGIALMSEIFAVCRHDLYVLSTHDGTMEEANRNELGSRTSNSIRISGPKRKDANDRLKRALAEGISFNLHNVVANVSLKYSLMCEVDHSKAETMFLFKTFSSFF